MANFNAPLVGRIKVRNASVRRRVHTLGLRREVGVGFKIPAFAGCGHLGASMQDARQASDCTHCKPSNDSGGGLLSSTHWPLTTAKEAYGILEWGPPKCLLPHALQLGYLLCRGRNLGS